MFKQRVTDFVRFEPWNQVLKSSKAVKNMKSIGVCSMCLIED